MKAVFAEEMRELDRRTVEEAGMPSLLLMENAGRAVAEAAMSMLTENNTATRKACLFVGKGNNAGDALVAARYLINFGFSVRLLLFSNPSDFASDTALNFNILKSMQADMLTVKSEHDWDRALVYGTYADLLVDGLLGTGLRGPVEGSFARAIELMNSCGKKILSIDVPSGVNSDSGEVGGPAVRATQTVTLCLPKVGLLLPPGNIYTGRLVVAPIGMPANIIENAPVQQTIVTGELVSGQLPGRRLDAHKGSAKAAVIAGAPSTSGAAALCAEAALRSGAGVVRLFAAGSIAGVLAVKLTEVMVESWPEGGQGLDETATDRMIEQIGGYDSLALGPGLGRANGTSAAVCRLVENTDRVMVIDADALNILVGKTEILMKTREVPVLTPHLGEMARLTGMTVEEIQKEGVVRIARRFAGQWRAVVVLKGAPTVIALPSGDIFINSTGNPGMATAGSGDVLAGVITGLLAQGMDQAAAAVAGVYLCGLAGDLVAKDGMIGMAAGDILAALPAARQVLAQNG